ncbi:hypothetical protein [Deinococcus aerophilus]|uniref:Lipoprotein n=1 Tax=Deinococcus aerophilus TaxID=522488 RepID=A0ABQ2GR37_9DEIO|nr:hypothetical protein [Deinococcus aerophilus]GGM08996.1 hypothetical protein GCM10010841_16770 [Deinococcus aerophilus]
MKPLFLPVLSVALMLAACGGGGSPPAPTPPPTRSLYQGVWGWGIANPVTGEMIDSGGVVFTEEVTSQGHTAAAGLYLNQTAINNQANGRSGVAVLGPISAANKLETVFSLTTTNDNRLYFIGADSNNRLELYEGKPSFDGPGALVTASNQPGQDILVVLVQVSETVPSNAKDLGSLKESGKTLAVQALGARTQTRVAVEPQGHSNLLRAAEKSLSSSR